MTPARVVVLSVLSVLLTSGRASAQEATPTPPQEPEGLRLSAVPTATFNTDEGFGTGGVLTLFHDSGGVKPYRNAVTVNAFISSKLVQAHAITLDALRPFDIPGRAWLRVGYFSTVSQNYCGVGNAVTCAPGEAAAQARALDDRIGLTTQEQEDVQRRYFLMRFIRPHATVLLRPWLRDKPYRTELLLGWRGSYTIPGDLFERGPYPTSRYGQDFPRGEQGFSSAPIVGVIVDNRDHEVFPTAGFITEASVRGAHPWTGATWSYAAANVQGALFLTLLREPRVVLAQRLLADVIVGNPSIEEMARMAGSNESIAFGGSSIGRGIREHRYLGKLKAISQTELRAQLFANEIFEQRLSHGVALFSDAAWIGYDINDVRGHPFQLLGTVGVSYRLLWNDTFAIRWDLAVSPNEAQGPGFYIIVGQVF